MREGQVQEQPEHVVQDVPTEEEASREIRRLVLKLVLCGPDVFTAAEFLRLLELLRIESALAEEVSEI